MKPTPTDTARAEAMAKAHHHLTWHNDWDFKDAEPAYVGAELDSITLHFNHALEPIRASFTFYQRVG